MKEHAPKLNNINMFPPEDSQVPELAEYVEVGQDSLYSGSEDEYYSSDEGYCVDGSDTQSELDNDGVVPETQEHVLDPRINGIRVLNIWSHLRLNFINFPTITSYCL